MKDVTEVMSKTKLSGLCYVELLLGDGLNVTMETTHVVDNGTGGLTFHAFAPRLQIAPVTSATPATTPRKKKT